jgi:predicted GNAT family acetyltransferase
MDRAIRHDQAAHRFTLLSDGREAVLDYAMVGDDTVDFRSTFVPADLRERGLGTALVLHALDWARERNLTVVPSCWFVGAVVSRHLEYRALLARE